MAVKQNPRPYLADPKRRQQRQQRQDKRRRESQRKVTEPLTSQGLRKETRAATNLRFRPLEKEIAGELRASNRRVGEQGDWWQQYLNTVNAGQADTTAAYQAAGAAQQAQMGQASAIDTENTGRLQADAAKSAELRGVAPSTAPAEREAAMQAQRNYLSTAQAGTTALQGATQRGYLNEQKRIGVGQSIASRKEEQRRGRSIMQDRRDVRSERGDYAATKRGELRDKERDYLIQNRAFPEAKAERAQQEREGAVDDARADRTESRQEREFRHEREQDAKGPAKEGARTPTQIREDKRARRAAAAAGWRTIQANGIPKSRQEWAGLEAIIAQEEGINAAQAHAAAERIKQKLISEGKVGGGVGPRGTHR